MLLSEWRFLLGLELRSLATSSCSRFFEGREEEEASFSLRDDFFAGDDDDDDEHEVDFLSLRSRLRWLSESRELRERLTVFSRSLSLYI